MIPISINKYNYFVEPDFKSTFPNGELIEEIYDASTGFNLPPNMVLKFQEVLFGLKASCKSLDYSIGIISEKSSET